MSTDISTVEEVAFGAARTAAEVASDPIGSARKQVKGLKRKGSPTARKVNRQLTEQINAATAPTKDAATGLATTAEKGPPALVRDRAAFGGLHWPRGQARRQSQWAATAKRPFTLC